jgi:phosphatidate cytidylyltransferase
LKETVVRSLTGILFLAVIILSLILHPYVYLTLFSLVCLLGWFEFTGLFRPEGKSRFRFTGALLITGTFIIIFFVLNRKISSYFLLIPGLSLILAILGDLVDKTTIPGRGIPVYTAGFLYIGTGLSCLHWLAFRTVPSEGYSPVWILNTCYLLWTYDTMAYVTGKLAGKHPLWASISPGKTWEGSIGGALFAIILATVLGRFNQALPLFEWIGLAIIVVVPGSLGDLFESWLKRRTGAKDSGKLLPGHGGILDRFDSLLLAVPCTTVYLLFVL